MPAWLPHLPTGPAALMCPPNRHLPPTQDAWVRQFHAAVTLPPRRGGGGRPNLLSQRLWEREFTDELWL